MKVRKLTKRESVNLYHYGTAFYELSPQNIWQAARHDLQSKKINAEIRRERLQHVKRSAARKNAGVLRKYAFLRRHVSKATTAAELLEIAIAEIGQGRLRASDANSLRVYSSEERLREALALANDRPEDGELPDAAANTQPRMF